MLTPWLRRWQLIPDGAPVVTHGSVLLPVRHGPRAAMLKVTRSDEERRGNALMAWWGGDAAARVLFCEDNAVLLERAAATPSLEAMTGSGADAQALAILCDVAARLHAPRPGQPPALVPLDQWFATLQGAAARHGGLFAGAQAAASALLAQPRDLAVLHGDLHHGNVLHFGARGWLAIDPKGLHGERGFDYANLFCNPTSALATDPARFDARLAQVVRVAGLDARRQLCWILAWAGLSAAWHLEDGTSPAVALAVGALARARLG